MNNRLRYAYQGFLIEKVNSTTGQWSQDTIVHIHKIRQLAQAHHRPCENACNGEGWIPRKGHFTTGQPNGITKSAYIDNTEETLFDLEISHLESNMELKAYQTPFVLEFQHDPRGATVKVFYAPSNFKDRKAVTEILYL